MTGYNAAQYCLGVIDPQHNVALQGLFLDPKMNKNCADNSGSFIIICSRHISEVIAESNKLVSQKTAILK